MSQLPMYVPPPTSLNTSLEAWIDDKPRVAGVDKGRIYNTWVDCPFSVQPNRARAAGFEWTAVFYAKDEPEDSPYKERLFTGVSATRALARRDAFDAITKRMSEIVELRRDVIREREAHARYMTTTTPRQRLWHRVRAAVLAFFHRLRRRV